MGFCGAVSAVDISTDGSRLICGYAKGLVSTLNPPEPLLSFVDSTWTYWEVDVKVIRLSVCCLSDHSLGFVHTQVPAFHHRCSSSWLWSSQSQSEWGSMSTAHAKAACTCIYSVLTMHRNLKYPYVRLCYRMYSVHCVCNNSTDFSSWMTPPWLCSAILEDICSYWSSSELNFNLVNPCTLQYSCVHKPQLLCAPHESAHENTCTHECYQLQSVYQDLYVLLLTRRSIVGRNWISECIFSGWWVGNMSTCTCVCDRKVYTWTIAARDAEKGMYMYMYISCTRN